jgi:uncharacterized protein
VHIKTGDHRQRTLAQQEAADAAFKSGRRGMQPGEVAAYYRERSIHACIFDVDKETATGLRNSNDEIAAVASEFPDVFTGIASVDPWKGEAAVQEVRRCVTELGLKGVKFQPISQKFYMSDQRFYPLWGAISELGVPIIVHTGTTAIGRGTPGGGGLLLDHGRPMPHLDRVAADFPDLRIVAAHPGWPWHEELLAVVQHKENVYMDLSGWAPKYFPEITVKYMKSLIPEKVLFGSDFPLLTPDRWLKDFDALALSDAVRERITVENASALFDIKV